MDYKIVGLKTLGATVIGGAVVGGIYYYKTLDYEFQEEVVPRREFNRPIFKTIREALAGKKPLINTGETKNEIWKKLIEKHQAQAENQDKKIEIPDLKKEKDTQSESFNIAIFKHACERLFEKPESLEEEKQIAENWCTEDSQLLKDNKPPAPSGGGA